MLVLRLGAAQVSEHGFVVVVAAAAAVVVVVVGFIRSCMGHSSVVLKRTEGQRLAGGGVESALNM